uniref:Uncharacterized protein n=1 Tax=Tetranychus urticae TaxID=32264 RepID=T1L4A2_TETUR
MGYLGCFKTGRLIAFSFQFRLTHLKHQDGLLR